jgi:hypothetical protein
VTDHEEHVPLGFHLAAGAAAEAYSVYQSTGDPQAAGRAAGTYALYFLPLVALGFVATFCGLLALLATVFADFGPMVGFGIASALSSWAFVATWRAYRRSITRLVAPPMPPPIPGPRRG